MQTRSTEPVGRDAAPVDGDAHGEAGQYPHHRVERAQVSGPSEQEHRVPPASYHDVAPRPFDVERALRAAMNAPPPSGTDADAALREALVRICRDAQREGVPVERVLVQFKHLWHEAADAREGRTHASQERLSRLVSSCIVSYFDQR